MRVGRQVSHPEEAEPEGEDRAENDDRPAHDDADQQDHDPDGEADGPQARSWNVRVFAVRFQATR